MAYGLARVDVASLMPDYNNSAAPGAALAMDTNRMTNAMHTIACIVTADQGPAAGTGYFHVLHAASAARPAAQPKRSGSALAQAL